MTMTNEEKIKKMNEIKDEYFRRMQVLRDEQARLVRELIEKRDKEKQQDVLNKINV